MKNIFKMNEIELIKLIQDKNTTTYNKEIARSIIFKTYKKLVISIAQKFAKVDCEVQDLIQEGYRGLTIAINKFDIKRNIKLTTYAYQWIFQSIQRNVDKNCRLINVPQTLKDKCKYIKNVRENFFETCGYYPTITELASILKMNKSKVYKILHSCDGVAPLDKVVSNSDGKETNCAAFIADDKLIASEQIIVEENYLELHKLLKAILTEREYFIICWKAGLNTRELTIKEIANKLLLSIPRIKQILNDVRNKIFSCKQIKDIWEQLTE